MPDETTLPNSSRLDWRRIDRWSAEIASGGIGDLRRKFMAEGARGPEIAWQPPLERLAAPQLRFLMRYWLDLANARRMRLASEIDAFEMRPALGYIVLIDVVDGGQDFRYRLFGTIIAGVSGFDMSGQLVSNHKASPYIVEFALAAYRAVLERGEPLLTEHGPPATVNTVAWHRLVLPLAGANDAITRFLIGNVPTARGGRPVALRL
jgi:hypothetical protein